MNMRNDRPSQIEKVIKERSKRKWWQRAVSILSAVAVFCTTYAMILPAITWERSLLCEIPAHRHNESCYEMKIVPGEKELVCLETEHEHGPECYKVTDNLICGLEECEGHTHGEGCFDEAGVLICTLEESEGHSHSEACYEKELVCQIPEHVHSEDCWAEGESHEKKVLVCQLEEHEHSAACFDAPPAEDDGYYCGQIEHVHSEKQYCYFSDGSLWCTIPEHVHTLACKSNPNADVESEAKWCSTFANVSLTGNWAEDVIAIANTQLGYTESTRNYEVQEDGTTIKGYTRYGNWYGNSYGDWCAMFCSFCLNYADVDSEIMPFEASCLRWVEKLTDKDMFRESIYYKGAKDDTTEYQPKPGDLIFFDWDEELDPDHVGLVYELVRDENDKVTEIKTIEGNNGNRVDYHTYEFTNSDIMGYGELPENPELLEKEALEGVVAEERTIKSEPASDGAVAVVTGRIPENAVVEIEAVTLTEEQLFEFFGEEKAAVISGYVAYDITILVNGEEWQPDETVSVTIEHPSLDVKDDGNVSVAHVTNEFENEIADVSNVEFSNDNLHFNTDGFSLYIIYTYTVDFYYGDLFFSIAGESSVTLTELFEKLCINRNVKDVVNVSFSNEALVNVVFNEETGEWTLVSLRPFTSSEGLDIWFNDEEHIHIDVYDAVVNPVECVSVKNERTGVTEVYDSLASAMAAIGDGTDSYTVTFLKDYIINTDTAPTDNDAIAAYGANAQKIKFTSKVSADEMVKVSLAGNVDLILACAETEFDEIVFESSSQYTQYTINIFACGKKLTMGEQVSIGTRVSANIYGGLKDAVTGSETSPANADLTIKGGRYVSVVGGTNTNLKYTGDITVLIGGTASINTLALCGYYAIASYFPVTNHVTASIDGSEGATVKAITAARNTSANVDDPTAPVEVTLREMSGINNIRLGDIATVNSRLTIQGTVETTDNVSYLQVGSLTLDEGAVLDFGALDRSHYFNVSNGNLTLKKNAEIHIKSTKLNGIFVSSGNLILEEGAILEAEFKSKTTDGFSVGFVGTGNVTLAEKAQISIINGYVYGGLVKYGDITLAADPDTKIIIDGNTGGLVLYSGNIVLGDDSCIEVTGDFTTSSSGGAGFVEIGKNAEIIVGGKVPSRFSTGAMTIHDGGSLRIGTTVPYLTGGSGDLTMGKDASIWVGTISASSSSTRPVVAGSLIMDQNSSIYVGGTINTGSAGTPIVGGDLVLNGNAHLVLNGNSSKSNRILRINGHMDGEGTLDILVWDRLGFAEGDIILKFPNATAAASADGRLLQPIRSNDTYGFWIHDPASESGTIVIEKIAPALRVNNTNIFRGTVSSIYDADPEQPDKYICTYSFEPNSGCHLELDKLGFYALPIKISGDSFTWSCEGTFHEGIHEGEQYSGTVEYDSYGNVCKLVMTVDGSVLDKLWLNVEWSGTGSAPTVNEPIPDNQEIEAEYKKTSELTEEDKQDTYQKNYQKNRSDDAYLYTSAEWTDKENGEATVNATAAIREEKLSRPLYVLQTCTAHGFSDGIADKNFRDLNEWYGSFDFVMQNAEDPAIGVGDNVFMVLNTSGLTSSELLSRAHFASARHWQKATLLSLYYYFFDEFGNQIRYPSAVYVSADSIDFGFWPTGWDVDGNSVTGKIVDDRIHELFKVLKEYAENGRYFYMTATKQTNNSEGDAYIYGDRDYTDSPSLYTVWMANPLTYPEVDSIRNAYNGTYNAGGYKYLYTQHFEEAGITSTKQSVIGLTLDKYITDNFDVTDVIVPEGYELVHKNGSSLYEMTKTGIPTPDDPGTLSILLKAKEGMAYQDDWFDLIDAHNKAELQLMDKTLLLTESPKLFLAHDDTPKLPETGGIGVYPIYALGALLVAGPIVYGCILRRKRERRAKE